MPPAAASTTCGHTLEPVTLRPGAHGIEADPPIIRGRHGLVVRADGQELSALPGEVLSEGLDDVEAMLDHAAEQAGLPRQAWRSAQATFRFETDAWLSPGPGLALVTVDGFEPTPLPAPTPAEVRASALAAVRWLTSQLRPDGSLGASFDPLTARSTEAECSIEAAALAARAFEAAQTLDADPVLLAAATHVLDRVVGRLGAPDHPAAVAAPTIRELAETVLALSRLGERPIGPNEALRPAVVRGALERLRTCRPDARDRGVVALALASDPLDGAHAARAQAILADAARGPLDAELVVALVDGPHAGVDLPAVLSAWARAELEHVRGLPLAPTPPAVDRAVRLAALARAARIVPDAGLRDALLDQTLAVIALQLGPRHRHLLRSKDLALGGIRDEATRIALRPGTAAETVLALVEARAVLAQ